MNESDVIARAMGERINELQLDLLHQNRIVWLLAQRAGGQIKIGREEYESIPKNASLNSEGTPDGSEIIYHAGISDGESDEEV